MENKEELLASIKQQRRTIINVAYKAKQGHLSSSFSILETINVLYKYIMHFDALDPDSLDNDQFVLSKGHASLALYAILEELHCITKDQLFSFSEFDSILGEHPDRNKVPGVAISTGSLGHGMPSAVGIAAGFKAQGKTNKTYCIIGDGEANEGSIWEAANVASYLKLNNIICIVDDNDSASHMPNLGEKFKAFGWAVTEINGNDIEQVYEALSKEYDKPYLIWSHTIKGNGSKIMENDPEGWHHHLINESDYQQLMEELQ